MQAMLKYQQQLLQLRKLQEQFRLKSQSPILKEGKSIRFHPDYVETQALDSEAFDVQAWQILPFTC